jgi:hypothetical protein
MTWPCSASSLPEIQPRSLREVRIASMWYLIFTTLLVHIHLALGIPQSFDEHHDSDTDSFGTYDRIQYDDYPMDYDFVGMTEDDPEPEDIREDVDCSSGNLPVWLPPLISHGDSIPISEFDSLNDLCAYNGNQDINMHIRCDYQKTPPTLIVDMYPLSITYYDHQAVLDHCFRFCRCRHFPAPPPPPPTVPPSRRKCDAHKHHRSKSNCMGSQGSSPLMFSIDPEETQIDHQPSKSTCRGGDTCSSFQACDKDINGCKCVTSRAWSNGPNLWKGTCRFPFSGPTVSGLGGRRKRGDEEDRYHLDLNGDGDTIVNVDGDVDVDVACACNSTYVSRSCCSSSSGLVWEHESLYLGQMLLLEQEGDLRKI